ncbi:hypothetical protein [Paenibacillus cineris]|uniref:Uncharacterized protein n=1 Tax=Paenibacillus cineris TaxID=237530 RepID=A0ABQ4LK52_9BACL|nr:hypothetical protein [Paenibacillus cineris]GIO56904.1 hypothetical protein J21TS7_52220 [Paenibacillus cineris]
MLDTAMIWRLYEKYYTLKYTKKRISRKEMKVIIDSINEQLCNYYFQESPSGQRTRALINKNIQNFSNQEDKEILIALDAVLREYPIVFSKTYSDHNSDLDSFMNKELKKLSNTLINHSLFKNDDNAKRLRGLLV